MLGPGLITGAPDDDPSGIATYSQAGAKFGLGMLWMVPIPLSYDADYRGNVRKGRTHYWKRFGIGYQEKILEELHYTARHTSTHCYNEVFIQNLK